MTTLLAFLRRDWFVWSSYRFASVQQVVLVFGLVGLTYFIAKAVGGGVVGASHEAEFVSFALAGVAFTDIFTACLIAIGQSIREAQLSGTLESLLLAPVGLPRLLIGSSLFRILQSLARVLIYISVGVLLLGYWHSANLVTATLVFANAFLAFTSLGILAGAFVVIVKQGDPIVMGFAVLSGILGGTFFPTTVLPTWIQPLTAVFPLTHSLAGMRLALAGAEPGAVLPSVSALLATSAVVLPAALFTFRFALSHAKREGSLVQY